MSGASAWTDWAWWIAGWATVALAGALVLWALAWDRARGRLRCPSCWCDMRGSGLTCPECGKTARSERALRRSRRRWRWAGAGVALAAVGLQATQQPDRRTEGWTRAIPTSVLVFAPGPSTNVNTPIGRALDMRMLSRWQQAVAEWRMLSFDETRVGALVETREKWPAGIEPLVRAGFDEGVLPRVGFRTLVIQLEGDPSREAAVPLDPPHIIVDRFGVPKDTFRLPARPAGVYTDAFIVRVKAGGWTIARWRVERRCEVVESMAEAMPARDSPQIAKAVRAGLRLYSFAEESFEVDCYDVFDKGHGIALAGEVLVDGVVAASLDESQGFLVRMEGAGGTITTGGIEPLRFIREHVRLRLRGDPERTLMIRGATAYWSGTLEVSAAELLDRK